MSIFRISQTLLIGMMATSVLALISAFYTDLALGFEIFVIVIALIGILWGRKELQYLFAFQKHFFKKPFWIFLVIILFLVSFAPYILDHFGYYVPTITVLNARGIQTGIANIELVLGQNSIWHFLQASIDNSLDVFLRINGFLLLVYLMYCFEQNKKYLFVFIPFFVLFIQSPSPDLAVYIIAVYIVHEFYYGKNVNLIALGILCIWVLMIKPTAFWLPFWFGLELLLKRSPAQSKNLITFTTWALILISLNTFKNYLSSSNLLFPLSFTYVKSQWKPDDRIIKQSAEYAQMKTYNFEYSLEEIVDFDVAETLMNWLQLGGFKSFLHIFILLSILVFSYWVWKGKHKKFYTLYFLLMLKFIVVFQFSAQARFFWEGILVMIMIILSTYKKPKLYSLITFLGFSLSLLIFSFPKILTENISSFKLSEMMKGFEWKQLYQPIYYSVDYSSDHQKGNLYYHQPKEYPFLFDTPFVGLSDSDVEYYESLGIFPQWENNVIVMKPLNQME